MDKINKWNKELLYAFIFLAVAIAIRFGDLIYKIYDLIYALMPNLRYKLLVSGRNIIVDKTQEIIIMVTFFFFLACSIYTGIKSIKKFPAIEGKRKIFNIIPPHLLGFLTSLVVLISILLIIMFAISLFVAPI